MAPHGWNHIFGDTSPNRRLNGAAQYPDNSPTSAFRVGRFSTNARAYANRYLRDAPPTTCSAGTQIEYPVADIQRLERKE